MRNRLAFAMVVMLSISPIFSGCDLVKKLTHGGKDSDSGPEAVKPDSEVPPSNVESPPAAPHKNKYKTLKCCTITNFRAGIIEKGENGVITVKEVEEIPYVPGTYIGVRFNYESKTGKPIEYLEEEFFPEAPLYWEEIAGKNYKVFVDEKRAEYTSMLPPVTKDNSFTSYWILKPSGDPVGKWIWDIYFDSEYYTTVIFNIVKIAPGKK
ncbi:MAG: hypothetical protein JW984_11120 [Deltaproteobacteria bacterium]|uniref:DUF3859 domain-containing protein n=1 Tax=Candidatus Zymogenus saltonus TaxID=2844893 RepID=A0A9D8KGQ1_9DELT|nr:hypothetical protein [Candidatus Zymogenus saltonus]